MYTLTNDLLVLFINFTNVKSKFMLKRLVALLAAADEQLLDKAKCLICCWEGGENSITCIFN